MSNGRGSEASDAILEGINSLQNSGFALLDGGFATHIEDALGQDISSSPLWSASLLDSEQGSKAIIQTHLDFLKAGADVVSTSSYQASTLAFRLAGMPAEKAEQLLIRSVQLAQQAREEFLLIQSKSQVRSSRPLLLLSLGPYGAALSNGSEYTGDYFLPDEEKDNKSGVPVTLQDLEEFHFDRLQTIASNEVWSNVDLIAFETIPRLDEAIGIRRALDRLFSVFPRKFSYASFVFPQGHLLPWPVERQGTEDMEILLKQIVGINEQGQSSPLTGVGINCTKPKYLTLLVGELTTALAQVKTHKKPYLFLYPDGGLVWDGIKRVWSEEKGTHLSSLSWSDQVMESAKASRLGNSLWAGCFVGGCCKATTCDISALRACLNGNDMT